MSYVGNVEVIDDPGPVPPARCERCGVLVEQQIVYRVPHAHGCTLAKLGLLTAGYWCDCGHVWTADYLNTGEVGG